MNAMTATAFRQANLLAAIEREGGVGVVADKAGVPSQYISQLKSGARNIGSRTARKLELALGMEPGSFDLPPASADAEIEAYLQRIPEAEAIDIISEMVDGISPEGARRLSLRLLARLAEGE